MTDIAGLIAELQSAARRFSQQPMCEPDGVMCSRAAAALAALPGEPVAWQKGFITCVSGDGRPRVEIAFNTLAEAQAAHRSLIASPHLPSREAVATAIVAYRAKPADEIADIILSLLGARTGPEK